MTAHLRQIISRTDSCKCQKVTKGALQERQTVKRSRVTTPLKWRKWRKSGPFRNGPKSVKRGPKRSPNRQKWPKVAKTTLKKCPKVTKLTKSRQKCLSEGKMSEVARNRVIWWSKVAKSAISSCDSSWKWKWPGTTGLQGVFAPKKCRFWGQKVTFSKWHFRHLSGGDPTEPFSRVLSTLWGPNFVNFDDSDTFRGLFRRFCVVLSILPRFGLI